MMNKKQRSLRPIAATALMAFTAVAGYMLPTTSAEAQDAETREKIRLMASALRARNDGELLKAKAQLEELIVLAPDDTSVQRLLASVNDAIDKEAVPQWAGNTATVEAQPVSSEPVIVAQADTSGSSWDFSSTPSATTTTSTPAATSMSASEVKDLPVAQTYPAGSEAPAASVDYAALNEIPDSEAAKETKGFQKERTLLDAAKDALEADDVAQAYALLDAYEVQNGYSTESRKAEYAIRKESTNPQNVDIREVSPGYVEKERDLNQRIAKGRAQYIAGDFDGAGATFNEIETIDPDNRLAKYFLRKIALERAEGSRLDVGKTRAEMLQEVAQNWQRPRIFDRATETGVVEEKSPLELRMEAITIPEVSFPGTPISQVAATLSALAEEQSGQGINIIVLDPAGSDPSVNINLKNLTLDVMLSYICRSVNFGYTVEDEAIVLRPGREDTGTITEFYSITRPQIIRMIGAPSGGGATASADPFAPAPAGGGGGGGADEEAESIKAFLERAGVPFESIPNATLAMGDGELIVTNTPDNHDRITEILRRFSEVKQVEIEAKFLEVQQGDLEELGVNWGFNSNTDTRGIITTSNRSLTGVFNQESISSDIVVSGIATDSTPVASNSPPSLPNIIDLGSDVASSANAETGIVSSFGSDLFTLSGILGNVEVNAVVRALSRKQGTDLMSAPKVTVLSGKTAEIVVAQELRYPESYSDIEAEVSTSETGGSAVAITAGTPQDFVTRNIGVEMEVVPTVEKDNRISLQLEPQVTEFEGFVEFGGPSIAAVGNTTVTVPAGFYQPVFSTRRVRTEVTVWDGATVVLGGLTREEVVTLNDRVPVLGDMPLVGRLFRSEGESTQKRNLLIFVSANLISPGGSPSLQNFNVLNSNSLFQNPTIVTPGGGIRRSLKTGAEAE